MTVSCNSTTKKKARVTSGIRAGLNKGFQTTKRDTKINLKTRLGLPKQRLRAVKNVIRDVCGLTPLEKRVQEMLRVGKEKRALKLVKKRMGNMKVSKKIRARVEDFTRRTTTKKK